MLYGNVNMLALERLKEVQDRFNLLQSQKTDLIKTRTQIERFLTDLDKEAIKKFEKTLQGVKFHFNEIFRKLFGGGKAELHVIKDEKVDTLEQGIEIMVKLPENEFKNLSLLSGGEKSLSSIALVLAIFKVNVNPFCILDEVDAALDENNIVKFAGLIREFSKDTQIIIITHNKRTMLEADVIYGLTKDTSGISKKIVVDLKEVA
jgi:chromosome segregation protein